MGMSFQDMLIESIVEHTSKGSEHQVHWHCMYCIALESVLVAFLVGRAFPAAELDDGSDSHHPVMLELELALLPKQEGQKDSSDATKEEGRSNQRTGEDELDLAV